MASSDPKLKAGFPLPLWMKNKPTKDFDFAASPPSPEDSFFFIRYPKKDMLLGNNQLEQDLPKLLTEQPSQLPDAAYIKDKDWTKHTKPCQDVLHGIVPINTAANPVSSKTIDNESKEEAACGNSVVKVAHQMMSSGRSPRGFTVAEPDEESEAPNSRYLSARRGSRSLPTTPHSSPTSRRKKNAGNRYFTSPFEPTEDANNRSWLTMALLGFKKDLTTSTSTLAEEDAIETRLHGGTLAESVESLGPAPRAHHRPSPIEHNTTTTATLRAKPTELRELNFWSPTSM